MNTKLNQPSSSEALNYAWNEAYDPGSAQYFLAFKARNSGLISQAFIRYIANYGILEMVVPKADSNTQSLVKRKIEKKGLDVAFEDYPHLFPLALNVSADFETRKIVSQLHERSKHLQRDRDDTDAYILPLNDSVQIGYAINSTLHPLRVTDGTGTGAFSYYDSLIFRFWQWGRQEALANKTYRDTLVHGLPRILGHTDFTVIPRSISGLKSEVKSFVLR